MWSKTKPEFRMASGFKSPSLHVWAGLWAGGLVGPFFFNGNITGASYLDMLKFNVWPALHQIPNLDHMMFEQDGAPPHWSLAVRQWLDKHFPTKWIGRNGPIAWPPRSPDITPMDFSLFGTVKDRVYSRKAKSMDQMKQFVIEEFEKIDLGYCQRTCAHVMKRMKACVRMGGAQTER
jgi:hypothetical protein